MSPLSIESLEELTRGLERDVPAVKGAFPDFSRLSAEWSRPIQHQSVYVFGTIKSGKSTLVNALIGQDMMPRGAGVRTFTRASVVHGPSFSARILFTSGPNIALRLVHDFRIIGVDISTFENPFETATRVRLFDHFNAFVSEAKADGRYARLVGQRYETSILSLAFTRLERTLKALTHAADSLPEPVLAQIRDRAELVFFDKDRGELRHWLDSEHLAPIIEEVEIVCPFPDALESNVKLVDCQGADSLNPLDFASLDAVIHKADKIVYVINSRLGLRDADARLLRHLVSRHAGDKLTCVVNMEAYDPLSAAEQDRILKRIKADFAQATNRENDDVVIFTANAWWALCSSINKTEADRIAEKWRESDVQNSFDKIAQQTHALKTSLISSSSATERSRHVALSSLIARAEKTAEALLNVDSSLYGDNVSQGERPPALVIQAFSRIISGENHAIARLIASECQNDFAPGGKVASAVLSFMESCKKDPEIPEDAGTTLTDITANAMDAFHRAWTELEQRLQREIITPLVQRVRTHVLSSLANLHSMLPSTLGRDVLTAIGPLAYDPETFLTHMGLEFDHALGELARPPVIRPVVLTPVVTSGLYAEFYARKIFGTLWEKVNKAKASDEPDAKRIVRLWRGTHRAMVKAARDDAEFSVSSCRENLKFQYFFKAMDIVLTNLSATFSAAVEDHYKALTDAAVTKRQLLSAKDRFRLEAYIDALRKPH